MNLSIFIIWLIYQEVYKTFTSLKERRVPHLLHLLSFTRCHTVDQKTNPVRSFPINSRGQSRQGEYQTDTGDDPL